MANFQTNIQDDIDAVGKIPVVKTILEVVCRTTGMGFAAIARVTEDKWVACSVLDEIDFGLKPGGELVLETTICNEIRQSGKEVVIDHVANDIAFVDHHTPAMYGFQSYISMPINLKDGSFFGTLCAIDPRPAVLNTPQVLGMFKLFADLISFHLAAVGELISTENKLAEGVRAAKAKEVAHKQKQLLNEELSAANAKLHAANDELAESQQKLRDALAKLTNSEARLRVIFEQAPSGISLLTGPDLIITSVNDRMLKIWDKTDSIIGMPHSMAVPISQQQPYLDILDKVYKTGEPYRGHEMKAVVTFEGKQQDRYFNFVYQPIKNEQGQTAAVLMIVDDVTEGVSAKQETERMQDQFRLAVDSADLGTWFIDAETREFLASHRFKELFGFNHQDKISYEDVVKQITDDYRESAFAAAQRSIALKDGYDLECPVIGYHDRKLRWLRMTGKQYITDPSKPPYFSGTAMDITERKEDEQRKNDFIAMVSHELKTPLTSLKGYIQMLQMKAQRSQDSFTAGALAKADTQVNKMNKLIQGFLDVARLEAGKIHLDIESFNLAGLIKETIEEFDLTMNSHNIIFKPCDTLMVNADKDKIGQVMNNLLSNAMKYSPRSSEIEIKCQRIDNNVQVSVKDHGEGIIAEDLDKLFDRFYRVDSKQTKNISGFGLGLYLCAEIIQRHNGKIWVESETGIGSTFYFSLPVS